jgi:hypothetical protein
MWRVLGWNSCGWLGRRTASRVNVRIKPSLPGDVVVPKARSNPGYRIGNWRE